MNRNPLFHSHRATRLMLSRRSATSAPKHPKCPVSRCPNNMYSHAFICGDCMKLVPSTLTAELNAEPSMVVEDGRSVFNRTRDSLMAQIRQAAEDARARTSSTSTAAGGR